MLTLLVLILCCDRALPLEAVLEQDLFIATEGKEGRLHYAIAVGGDDNDTRTDGFVPDFAFARTLGLALDAEEVRFPDFLSSVYLPVQPYEHTVRLETHTYPEPDVHLALHYSQPIVTVRHVPLTLDTYLAPKPGRQLAKVGWDIEGDPEPLAKMSSVCKGLERDFSGIPVLRAVVSKYRDLSSRLAIVEDHKIQAIHFHQPCAATYSYMEERYGAGQDELFDLERLILESPPIASVVHPVADKLMAVDLYPLGGPTNRATVNATVGIASISTHV